jgi:hypothetical protein
MRSLAASIASTGDVHEKWWSRASAREDMVAIAAYLGTLEP